MATQNLQISNKLIRHAHNKKAVNYKEYTSTIPVVKLLSDKTTE